MPVDNPNMELIKTLVASAADNEIALVVQRVRELAERWGWNHEQSMSVVDVILEVRQAVLVGTQDNIEMVLRNHFQGQS